MNKILVIKLRAIGDVVMSTVVLDNLQARFPDAEIDFLTEGFCRDLVTDHPAVRRVWVVDKKAWRQQSRCKRFLEPLRLLTSIRRERYDAVFDFFGNPRSALITGLSGASLRIGYDYRVRRIAYNRIIRSRADQLHEVEWHLDALTACGIPIVRSFPRLVFHPTESVVETFWREKQ